MLDGQIWLPRGKSLPPSTVCKAWVMALGGRETPRSFYSWRRGPSASRPELAQELSCLAQSIKNRLLEGLQGVLEA